MSELQTLRELVEEMERDSNGHFALHYDAVLDDWGDDYVVFSTHRDADALDSINFDEMCLALEKAEGAYTTVRFGHFAVGHLDYIVVERDTPALTKAKELLERLADYPILNEDRLCTCTTCGYDFDTEDHDTVPPYCSSMCEDADEGNDEDE